MQQHLQLQHIPWHLWASKNQILPDVGQLSRSIKIKGFTLLRLQFTTTTTTATAIAIAKSLLKSSLLFFQTFNTILLLFYYYYYYQIIAFPFLLLTIISAAWKPRQVLYHLLNIHPIPSFVYYNLFFSIFLSFLYLTTITSM